MDQQVKDFWILHDIPVSRMLTRCSDYNVKPHQVEKAATIVYEEIQELIENVPEIKPWMANCKIQNGEAIWIPTRAYYKIVGLRNYFEPIEFGRRVYEIARCLKGYHYDTSLRQAEKRVKELEQKLEQRTLRYKFNNWMKTGHWR